MNDYTSPHRRNWSQASAIPSNQATSANNNKYTTPTTTFNNYAVPNTAKWMPPQTNSGANTPTNPSTLTTTFPSFSGGIPPLYPSISAQSSGSIQGGVPSPFPISNTTPRHKEAGMHTTHRSGLVDKTISASSSTNSLHNLTSGITKLQITTPYTPYNAGFTPYAVDIPTPNATTPNVGVHSNGTTPTGFKFNNFSYSNVNIATPTTPLNATKMGYAMNPNALHHTAAMNNIYAMNAAMRQNSFSALTSATTPTANLKTMPRVITPTNKIISQKAVSNNNNNNSTKLNSNAIPYHPSSKKSSPQQQLQQKKANNNNNNENDNTAFSYPSYAQAVNKEKDAKSEQNETDNNGDDDASQSQSQQQTNDHMSRKETEDAIQKLNPLHWPSNPRHAKFYVIKSFGEDDVHKSIKYNLWCSTERGNRKLDEAFNESKRINAANIANDANMNGMASKNDKSKEIDSRDTKRGCPVYMFFSVNRSGCFCGMAQMISNYYKERHFGSWVQDGKWQGSFIVKWIYVKDIPNKDLKDIQLPNNDNRPVTFSRDTQEIPFNQGVEMLRRFIKYEPKTNILQDFKYYDDRERDIKQKRTQQIILQRMTPSQQQQQQQQNENGHQQQQGQGQGPPQRLIDNDKYASHHQVPSQQHMNGGGGNHGQYGQYDNYGNDGGGGGRYRGYNKQTNHSQNGHFGHSNRRRYYSKNERDNSSYRSYNNQHNASYNSHHRSSNNANSNHSSNGGNNYGSYQILKRNNHHQNDDNNNGNMLNGDQNSDNSSPNRQRYNSNNNRSRNRWVPK